MANSKSTLTRKLSRSKLASVPNSHRTRTMTSGPRLGAYGRKHPAVPLRPGQKSVARREKRARSTGTSVSAVGMPHRSYGHDFMVYCIKELLTSSGLVAKEGRNWRLQQDIVGVSSGEFFTSLDACANAIISASEHRYVEPGTEEGIEEGGKVRSRAA